MFIHAYTIKALIKALLTILKGILFGAKNYFRPLGAPSLERCLQITVDLIPFQLKLQQVEVKVYKIYSKFFKQIHPYSGIVTASTS